ncbi:MAG: protein kinase, partial [Pseudomonadota bacterium]
MIEPEALLAEGTMVDEFRVVRLVGRGGMGEVYLARDTKLGRKVALKLIRPRALGGGDAVARFMREAQLTASFSHVNIVTVYRVGEHEGKPYLALEFLEGQTLRQRLLGERPGVREATRVGLAVAQALAEAHRHKVLHRDLKPENVLLAKDGGVRVLDLGLAKVLDEVGEVGKVGKGGEGGGEAPTKDSPGDEGGAGDGEVAAETAMEADQGDTKSMLCGTARYLAPESWLGEAAGEAADVWALGMILAELFLGRHPYHGLFGVQLRGQVVAAEPVPLAAPGAEVPSELVKLVAGCLDKDPARRPAALVVVKQLEEVLAQGGRPRTFAEESPFRGLFAFGELHSDLFFGRDAEIAAFLERLREQPVLAVVGPSGSGKSSFVKAGVVPRLREQGSWVVLMVRPGNDPFASLAGRLEAGESSTRVKPLDSSEMGSHLQRLLAEKPGMTLAEAEQHLSGGLALQLHAAPRQLSVMLEELAERQHSKVLLLVDQIEEAYTLVADEQVRARFLRAVCSAADDAHGRVRVVFTVRDDFLGRLAESGELEAALRQVTVLRRPGPEALRDILEKPIAAMGFKYESIELVEEMIRSVHDEPACLPLLQFAGQMLWERRDREQRFIRRQAYEAMGRITGVLAEHADGVLASLTPAQLKDARELLLRLVTAEGTRRVVAAATVLDGLGPGAAQVLTRLVQARLVTTRRGTRQGEGEAVLELVHESLVRSWGRLARWLEESREDVAFVADATQAAELWVRRGKREEEVWQGDALRDARGKASRLGAAIPDSVARFLDAGIRKEQRARRRKNSLLTIFIAGLAAVAVVAVLVAQLTLQQNKRAEQERAEAQAQRAEAQVQRTRAEQGEAESRREGASAALRRGDLFEARAKLRGSLETSDSTMGRVLWGELEQKALAWSRKLGGTVEDVAYSPDGKTVAGACADGKVYLVDAQTTAVQVLRGRVGVIKSVAFSPSGRYLAAGSDPGPVVLWDLRRGTARELVGHGAQVFGVAFDSDSEVLASASFDTTVRLWDVLSGRERLVLRGHERHVTRAAFGPAGVVYSASKDGTVRQWDVRTGGSRVAVRAGSQIYGLALDLAGDELITGCIDGTIRRWRLSTGEERMRLSGHRDLVTMTVLSPDRQTLASSSLDGTVLLWDRTTGRRSVLGRHQGIVSAVAASPDGLRVASSGHDNTLRSWQIGVETGGVEEHGHAGVVWALDSAVDGSTIVSGAEDQTVRIWDVRSGEQRMLMTGHGGTIAGVAFSPGGKTVASASHDRGIRVWDLENGSSEELQPRHGVQAWDVVFSSDGETIASAGADWRVRLWDARSFVTSGELRAESVVSSIAVSPGGSLVAAPAANGVVYVWEKTKPLPVARLRGHQGEVFGVAFAVDGRTLVSGGSDGEVRRWNLASKASAILGKHDAQVNRLAVSPDGRLLGTPSNDGTARLWELATGKPTAVLRGSRGRVVALRFIPDSKLVATSGADGTVRTWDVATGRPYWRAPLLLRSPPRVFTHLGWFLFDDEHGAAGKDNA